VNIEVERLSVPTIFKEARNDFQSVRDSAGHLPPAIKISAYFLAVYKITCFYLYLLVTSLLKTGRGKAVHEEVVRYKERYNKWLANSIDLEAAHGTVDFVKAMSRLVMFAAVPLVPFLMLWQAMPGRKRKHTSKTLTAPNACLCLPQYIYKQAPSNATFFTSRQFPWTLLFVVGSGAPAALTLLLYYLLGIDALLGYPSKDPHFRTVFIVIMLYIYSLAWCLSALFFRAYFLLPVGLDNNEYSIELQPDRLHQTATEGWFQKFFCPHEASYVRVMKWDDADSISYQNPKSEALLRSSNWSASQMLSGLRKSFPWFYALLTLFARISDRMSEDSGASDTITVIGRNKNQFGCAKSITIKLGALNRKDKARLFYAIRKWAPHLVISANVQQALIGSVVLNDPRYTHIWFDLLLPEKNKVSPMTGILNAGQALREGRFIIEQKLDSGGQAIVYIARDNLTQTTVVLKEFILTPGESIEALVASAIDFENESSVLSTLVHPKIVRFYDLFLEGHRVYLVLEHVEGKTLRAVVEDHGPLPEHTVVQLALQMCDVLKYIHSQSPPVIHRDFTPENLIRSSDGHLKLIDFSIAKQQKEFMPGDCAGKHAYTPPEQFRSEETPQSDIYAMGATLYFLLVGADPEPLSESSPRRTNSEISEALDMIIRNCTALELSDRYEEITWLQLDLEKANSMMLSKED
jgi:hypothetical protein